MMILKLKYFLQFIQKNKMQALIRLRLKIAPKLEAYVFISLIACEVVYR